MKKYIVKTEESEQVFTRKADAERAAKKIGGSVIIRDIPAPRYVETMRYYYRYFLEKAGCSIWDAYGKPSEKKVSSYKALKDIAVNNDCRVLGHNCNFYTAGMIFENKKTGELFFRVDTATNTRMIPLSYVS